jgi:hypothetical protein
MIVKDFHQISGKSFVIMTETAAPRGFSVQNGQGAEGGND